MQARLMCAIAVVGLQLAAHAAYDPLGLAQGTGSSYQPLGALQIESAPSQPTRRVLFFTATWCGYCQRSLGECGDWLRASGWVIADHDRGHVQLVDCDARPDLVARYGVRQIPAFVLVDADGRELGRAGWSGRSTIPNLMATPTPR